MRWMSKYTASRAVSVLRTLGDQRTMAQARLSTVTKKKHHDFTSLITHVPNEVSL